MALISSLSSYIFFLFSFVRRREEAKKIFEVKEGHIKLFIHRPKQFLHIPPQTPLPKTLRQQPTTTKKTTPAVEKICPSPYFSAKSSPWPPPSPVFRPF